MVDIGFDVISDLNLSPDDSFNWEGKATSLYCIVAGNVSSDLRTVIQTLAHLQRFYQGVFYVFGTLEYENCEDVEKRTQQLVNYCKKIPNVAVLHHHVVIVDGVAILGANGWTSKDSDSSDLHIKQEVLRFSDLAYLKQSIEKLQKHLDVKKIILITNSVPKLDLYFKQEPDVVKSQLPLDICLESDTEMKITKWIYGSYNNTVDITYGNIQYIANPYSGGKNYYAKRINVII